MHLSLYNFSTKEAAITFFSFVAIFIVTMNIINDKIQIKRMILIIIFLSLTITFYGIARKYFILGKELTGSFGTFGNRNQYAAYMVMVVPLTVGFALSCKNQFQKFIFAFFSAIITAGVFLSSSRGGSLSLIFSFALMFFLLKKEKLIKGNYWAFCIPIFLGIGFLLTTGFEPFKNRLFVLWESLGLRWTVNEEAFKIIKDFPLFGVGLGNFNHIFTIYQKSTYSLYYKHLHNDYLQLIIETGLIGAFVYFAFLFKIFKNIFSELKQRHDSFAKNIVIGGVCGLFGLMIHSFFDFNFHIPAVSLLFWFILALTYKCSYVHFYHAGTNET